ncbi:MAG: ADP-forming succinate--CoA ligase subunit beta [Candidatus Thermoplasmatota archaeon]|nr:ADP-forming succinate--CoA ligase subunit beta [Candidatus Thermoplasmatota archaeon]MBS3790866.1 ADP-forming succinate--CoA ligase subunit beta [Candidatus Thermoplasmatota archaeon]
MKLQEYQAAEIFEDYGIPVVDSYLIEEPEEIKEVKRPVVLKAQVTVGKRGKAGGILFAEDREEAVDKAEELFKKEIRGLEVEKILVAEKAEIENEYYVGMVMDREKKRPTLIMTTEGGMNIEEVAEEHPNKIAKKPIDPVMGLRGYEALHLADSIGLEGEELSQMAKIAQKLSQAFDDYDSELAEINPLVSTPEGLLAIDAVFNIDDNALYRQDFEKSESKLVTEREQKADEYDLAYVDLQGDIAIVGCGAGLVMATLDSVAEFGGEPACFLDLGGGADADDTKHALEIIDMKEGVKSIYLNIFGGITQCDKIAQGIIDYGPQKPTVVRMLGTNEEEGKRMLREAGYDVVDGMDEGAKKVVKIRE